MKNNITSSKDHFRKARKMMGRRKLKSLWSLMWAKHYAVLLGSNEQEINWAIETLRKADSSPLLDGESDG